MNGLQRIERPGFSDDWSATWDCLRKGICSGLQDLPLALLVQSDMLLKGDSPIHDAEMGFNLV